MHTNSPTHQLAVPRMRSSPRVCTSVLFIIIVRPRAAIFDTHAALLASVGSHYGNTLLYTYTRKTPAVIQPVLQKNHTSFLGPDAVLEEHDGSNRTASDSGSTTEPLEFSLDPLLLESINLNPGALEQSLSKYQVMFTADQEKGTLVFSPTGRPNPNWRQECESLVPQYLTQMTKESVHVPKEAATEARSLLQSLNKTNPSLSFSLSSDETEIAIAGETSSVASAKVALNSLCSDLVTRCTESVFLSPEDFDYLEQVKQHDLPPNVECTFDRNMFKLTLKGPKGTVMKLKDSVPKIASYSETSVFLDPLIIEFFKTQTGRGKLEEFLQERKCHVAVHFSEASAPCLYFLSDRNELEMTNKVKAITKQLPAFVLHQTIMIPDVIAPMFTDMNEFIQLCKSNERKYEVLIKQAGHEVSIAGFKIQVKSCVADLKVFFKEKSAPPTPLEVEVSGLVARSIERSPHGLQNCLRSFDGELHCDTVREIIRFAPSHHLTPGWEEKCRSVLFEFIKGNVVERSSMFPEKASVEISQILLISQQADRTFVSIQASATSVSFAGSPHTVKLTEQKIMQVCSSHAFTNEEIPLEPTLFEFVSQVKLHSMKKKFHGVSLKLVDERNSLTVSGLAKEVKEVVDYVPHLTTRMISVHVNIRKAIFLYLSSEKGKEKLVSFIREKRGENCAVYISPSSATLSLLCTLKHRTLAEKIAKAIADCTSMQILKIPQLIQPFFPELSEFTTIVEKFQGEMSAMIEIEGSDIVVTGFREEVGKAVDMLSVMAKEKVDHFKPVSVQIDHIVARCMQQNQEDLEFWASSLHVVCKLKLQGSKPTVIVSPTRDTQPDWKKHCERLLLSYLDDEYFKETITFPEEAAEDAGDVLVSTKYIVFEMGADGNNATLAGEKGAVKEVKKQIHDMCAQKQMTRKIELNHRENDFFAQVVQKTFKSITAFESSPEKHTITVAGSMNDVSAAVKSIKEAVQHAVVPVLVDAVMVRFIDTEGRRELEDKMYEAGVTAAIHVKMSVMPPTLELLCQEQLVYLVKHFAETIPRHVTATNVVLSEAFTKPPFSQELGKYSQELTTRHHVLIETRRDGLLICGFKQTAGDVQKSLEKFIKNKCKSSHTFDIQKGMWRLLAGPMNKQLNKIQNACQSSEVEYSVPSESAGGGYVIEFKGDEAKVQKIVKDLNGLLQSTHKTTMALKTAQICQYFLEKGEGARQIPGIEQQANAVMEVCRIRSSPRAKPKSSSAASKISEQCSALVIDAKHILIHLGDITEFPADVIVNAANEDLRHIGGLAYSILKKGGKEIQDVSDRYTKSHGKLSAGDVWLSTVVGRLPCQALIHAVGPRWKKNPTNRDHLKEACINCLTNAGGYKSIALPAISTGMFGCPMDQCADVMISSVVEFCKTQRHTPLDEINIVLFRISDVPPFIKALGTHLPAQNIKRKSLPSLPHASLPIPVPQQAYVEEGEEKEEQFEQTKAGSSRLSCVSIKEGGLLDATVRLHI